MIAGYRQHRENPDQRLEIFFAERIVDQEFQAQRHDHIEQRLDQHAEADKCDQLLVVAEEGFDETVDRRQRAGGFLGGIDDEFLIVLVVIELELVVLVVFLIVGGRRCLSPSIRTSRAAASFFSAATASESSADAATGSPDKAGFIEAGFVEEGLEAMKPTDAARPA